MAPSYLLAAATFIAALVGIPVEEASDWILKTIAILGSVFIMIRQLTMGRSTSLGLRPKGFRKTR